MKIVIIGSGNLATNLSLNILKTGHKIVQVISRTAENAEKLAKQLNCSHSNDIGQVQEADLYIIATNDDAIKTVAHHKQLTNKLIVHTSGTTNIDVLSGNSDKFGVIYPLQTFKKDVFVSFSELPIFVEASDPTTLEKLVNLSKSLSTNVYNYNSSQRLSLHLIAVFVNNFTNHIFHISQKIAEQQNIDFEIFTPLIETTFEKIINSNPTEIQTGPARRKDYQIINKHLEFLKESNDSYEKIYETLSKSIDKYYN